MITNNRAPIYLHSLFRAGSTYLFNVFRRSTSGFWCYQEPLNEFLLHADTKPERLLEIHQEAARFLRHNQLEKPYFYEFHTLAREVGRLFRKEFSYDQYFLGNSDDISSLRAYLSALIHGAPGRPMFQCCRSAGRVARMKRECEGGTHIFLWRNPWDQWWSYKLGFDTNNLLILNSTNLPDYLKVLKEELEIPEFHDPDTFNEYDFFKRRWLDASGSYKLFYALWCHAMLEALPSCDVTINIDRLSESKNYRAETANALAHFDIQGLDFSDAQVPMATYGEEDAVFFHEIEERIHGLLTSHGYGKSDIERINKLRAENRPQSQREVGVSKEILRDAMRGRSLVRQFESELNRAYKDAEATHWALQARAIGLETALEMTRKELHDVHQASNHQIQALLSSTSWRITSPLRWVVLAARDLNPNALKPRAKVLLQHAARYLRRRPWLKNSALRVLYRFPRLKSRLFRVVAGIKTPPATPENIPTDIAHLSPRARQIHADLKAASARRQKENC